MLTKEAADRDWQVSKLVSFAEAYAKKHPPLPRIEGPGFEMLGKPEPKPSSWRIPEHIILGMIGGLMSSLALLTLLYLSMPGLFNL